MGNRSLEGWKNGRSDFRRKEGSAQDAKIAMIRIGNRLERTALATSAGQAVDGN